MTLSDYLAAIEARRKRCSDILDAGGTEQALIGGDIDALLALLRRAVEGLEECEGKNSAIAKTALADLARFAEGEKENT